MFPRPTIEAFDVYLHDRQLRLEATIVGGSALVLLGVIDRQTRDVDVLAPPLPLAIADAARGFAQTMRGQGVGLQDDWLNNDPMQLGDVLPSGWQGRVRSVFVGDAVVLMALGRSDLLKTKLFALCDRGLDLADRLALAPTCAELEQAQPWVAEQDTHQQWPEHVAATFDDLSRRLGHGV